MVLKETLKKPLEQESQYWSDLPVAYKKKWQSIILGKYHKMNFPTLPTETRYAEKYQEINFL